MVYVHLFSVFYFRKRPYCFTLLFARLLLVIPFSSAEKIVIADAASGDIVGEVHIDASLIDHAALEKMNGDESDRDPKRLIGARFGMQLRKFLPFDGDTHSYLSA